MRRCTSILWPSSGDQGFGRTCAEWCSTTGSGSITDGPFAETKEQLAGYVLIEAPDLEAAKEMALTLPPGRVGSVEVRPVWEREDLVARRVTEDGRYGGRAVRR